jgi:hypothetical protein
MNKNLKLTIAIAFLAGYFISDVTDELGVRFISSVNADVAGMNYYDLKSDYDFVRAVKYVVTENCHTHINAQNLSTDHHCD